MARKMYREAVEAYSDGPEDSAILTNKTGIAFHQMLQLDQAKKYYERAIKLDKKYNEALNNLGTVYYARKSHREAVSLYNKALKLAPNSASIYSNLGTAQFARKKYTQAMEAYDRALSLDPDYSSTAVPRAFCFRSGAFRSVRSSTSTSLRPTLKQESSIGLCSMVNVWRKA